MKTTLKHFLITAFLLSVTLPLFGQKYISGTVKDEKGAPLPGVSVQVKGTSIATLTGLDGSFTLEGSDVGDILLFDYLGYKSKSLPWTGGSMSVILRAKNAPRWVAGHAVGIIKPLGKGSVETSLGSFVGLYNIGGSRFGADVHVTFPFIVVSPNVVVRAADRLYFRAGPVYNCFDTLKNGLGANAGVSVIIGKSLLASLDFQYYRSTYFTNTSSPEKYLALHLGLGWTF